VVPRAFPPRATESPSSLDKLLGCSLAWALEYHGGVRASDAADGGEVSPLLLGKLAHALVAEVFAGGALPAATAEAHAAALVDARLVDHCEVLALPRYQADRAALARAVVAAARRLAELITAAGATLRGFEVDLAGTVGGISLGGKADVVLDDPAAVIDLKWGRSKYVKQLESGTALQLATYAALLAVGGAAPEVAYLSLARTELLGPPGTALPGAVAIGATTTPATWAGALVAIRRRQAEVAVGRLLAPGATGISPAADLGVAADGALRVAPPCGYCALDVLCGRGGWT
jgi:RecB family exonuclease